MKYSALVATENKEDYILHCSNYYSLLLFVTLPGLFSPTPVLPLPFCRSMIPMKRPEVSALSCRHSVGTSLIRP